MSKQKYCDYLIGAAIAGIGIAIAHYCFHWHD